ncbi:DUF5812 family protein [Halorarum halobium]|uniref:DUF5812 family protein n=1 Tax=Halorarum halobium TaxID=3075121 RepID=UPI0028AE94AA|nr:DUF5812 family protein [Halobaculum sp. XH14]
MTDDEFDVDALERALSEAGEAPGSSETAQGADPERTEGTFLVTHAEEESAVLREVSTGRVLTLSENPGVEAEEAIEGVLAPEPPMNVTWELVEVAERRTLSLAEGEEPPTRDSLDTAAEQEVGELTRTERAGVGELHVVTVPEERTERAVADVLGDREATLARAARLGVNRVEVRSAPGVVVVRYLP